jgi:hypothetical protein
MRSGLIAAAGVLALSFPAGALAQGHAHGAAHGNAGQHGKGAQHGQGGKHGQGGQHGQGGTHRHVPTVALVASGTVVSIDTTSGTAVVEITHTNHHAELDGTQLTVDLTKAAISVADVNADGQQNMADLAAGDQVLVQARVPLRGALSGALVAQRLVDQTHPADSDDDGSSTPPADG